LVLGFFARNKPDKPRDSNRIRRYATFARDIALADARVWSLATMTLTAWPET
jgi:hypothetical protein